MKTNKTLILPALLFLFLVSASLVSAFGVSAPYWKDNPLVMTPGETRTVNLNLQNMVGNEDVTVKILVVEGEDIAQLEKDVFTIKAGTSDAVIPIKITLSKGGIEPKKIKLEIKSITPGETGSVSMGTGMVVAFDVVTITANATEQQPISKNSKMIIAVILAIAVIILVYTTFFKKNE